MRFSPDDRAFNDALRDEVSGAGTSARVLFFDTDNQVREAVYEAGFQSGELQAVRTRLEDAGVLKAIVLIEHSIGDRRGGPRTVSVSYLPAGMVYASRYDPPRMIWRRSRDQATEAIHQLFEEGDT